MSGFSFGGVYAENIFFIFIFFQYVLVLFDGCMIVYLLLSHVFGSVTGFVYMWKLSWASSFPKLLASPASFPTQTHQSLHSERYAISAPLSLSLSFCSFDNSFLECIEVVG